MTDSSDPTFNDTQSNEVEDVCDARRAHRRLFTLGASALIVAIVAMFFPRWGCSETEDLTGLGLSMSREELDRLISDSCANASVEGPAGQPGATGATGPAGQPGATGATGPAGRPGATGATGAAGACGAVGPRGIPGADGPPGAQGPAGPQGEQGSRGPAGPTGPVGPTGPSGPRGAQGPPGESGLGAFGSFWDQCTQQATIVNRPYPFLLSHADTFNTGVSIPGSTTNPVGGACTSGIVGSPGGSRISFVSAGVYNIQFSAQYWRTQGGSGTQMAIWLRKNGVDVPWTNTDFATESNSSKLAAVVNWFVPVTCTFSECDYYEIWWAADKSDVELLAVPAVVDTDPAEPNLSRPAIPSIIVTVTQVGGG